MNSALGRNLVNYYNLFFIFRKNPAFMSPTDNFFSPCTRKLASKRGLYHPNLIALYVPKRVNYIINLIRLNFILNLKHQTIINLIKVLYIIIIIIL